ncbi:MAG TPA: cupin domain-containing protein [Desulfobacterales bacterium]|nr:cupin domain-containing protein [Desulfobacterales bacterium]HIP40647.1 cupin domain-containing protein [Desulfocapsa sulfexigens]
MKCIHLADSREFDPDKFKRFLLHDSPYFRILNFNLAAGQVFPVHSHPADGQLSIQVIEGKGFFLGEGDATIPAGTGDVLISDISAPHGVKAETDMRILVTIAPPF